MLELAEHIVGTKAQDFNPAFLTDHYRAALVKMLKQKRAQLQIPETAPVPSQQTVVSLMDALERSLEAEASANPKPTIKPTKRKKRVAGQREMLLSITGKGAAKEASREKAKAPARPAARRKAR